jgi:hypothetical protein
VARAAASVRRLDAVATADLLIMPALRPLRARPPWLEADRDRDQDCSAVRTGADGTSPRDARRCGVRLVIVGTPNAGRTT